LRGWPRTIKLKSRKNCYKLNFGRESTEKNNIGGENA
jgi:hypothetical protein